MNKKTTQIIITVLVVAVIGLVVLNGLVYSFRLDLTENQAYTISQQSRDIFSRMPEQAVITYYLSEKLRARSFVPAQVQDFLLEYAANSGGRIRVEIIEVEKNKKEQEAQSRGIIPQQVEVAERNSLSLIEVYSGIVISYLDKRETLPLVFDLKTLEYELSSRLSRMVSGKIMTVGFLSGSKSDSLPTSYQTLNEMFNTMVTLKPVNPGEPIGLDINVLVVMGGKDLDAYDCAQINHYLMQGGRVMVAFEGVYVDIAANLMALPVRDVPMQKMLETWGVIIRSDMVMDEVNKPIPVRRAVGAFTVNASEPYPAWVSVSAANVSKTNPVTARFEGLDLYWASSLALVNPENSTAELLLSSGARSWRIEGPQFNTNPYEAAYTRFTAADGDGLYPLAFAIKASFPNAFAGQLPTRTGAPALPQPPAQSPETRLVVIGDSDFAKDIMQATRSWHNLRFLENTVNWLAGEEALLSMKTRADRDQRLNLISDEGVKNIVVFFAQLVNVLIVPLVLALIGLLRAFGRREQKLLAASAKNTKESGNE